MPEPHPLELTGERTLPGIPREAYWFARHLVAYQLAADLARGARVIDIGCGEGYGSALLAGCAASVLGVDIAPEVIEHARARYTGSRLSFEVMDVCKLKLPSSSFEVAVSMQVVEHLQDVERYFEEMLRVLVPGGLAVLTTPNRETISPGRNKPLNPFHFTEYTHQEFAALLRRHFDRVELSGVFHRGLLRLNDRLKVVDFIKFYEMGKFNPRYWTHRLLTPHIRSSNFRIDTARLDKCLDLVALCWAGAG